jgi:hypothetical protein
LFEFIYFSASVFTPPSPEQTDEKINDNLIDETPTTNSQISFEAYEAAYEEEPEEDRKVLLNNFEQKSKFRFFSSRTD